MFMSWLNNFQRFFFCSYPVKCAANNLDLLQHRCKTTLIWFAGIQQDSEMAYNYFALEFTTRAIPRHYSKAISDDDSFLGSYDLSLLRVFKLSILIQFEAYFNTSLLSGFFQEAIKNRCCLYFICLIQSSCKGGEI